MKSLRPALASLPEAMIASVVLLIGIFVAFYSQASSSDYHMLFRGVTVLAMVHFPLGILYFLLVRQWRRWLIAAIMGLAALSYIEFALRTF